jgi:vanillate O-demethylase ferredoxin subunit
MNMLDVVVHSISLASDSSRRIELRPVTGKLPPFTAGAHVDVRVGLALVRQYSLCNSPAQTHRYVICIGSAERHRDIHVGQRTQISVPRNHFPLVDAERYVLVAGGIGVTPLLSMAQELAARQAEFALHYYASSVANSPLLEWILASDFADRVVVHHSDAGDSIRGALPKGLREPDAGAAVYVCGPSGFMSYVVEQATGLGWQAGQIHLERFTPTVTDRDVDADGEFTVRLASTGLSYVIPADRTIAEVLVDNDVPVELSCEQGMCGACLTPVLSGQVDHRDEVQTDAERDANTHITICCSRSHSAELVLEI